MAQNTKMQTEQKNNETKRLERKKKLSTKVFFHSFNYVIDHASIRFFFYVNSLHCFVSFLLYYQLHLFSSDRFAAHIFLQLYKFLNFSLNHPRKRVFRNVSLSNLENVSQRNLRTDRAKDCIFKVSGGTNFWKFFRPCWCLRGFVVCTGLPPKKLWIRH